MEPMIYFAYGCFVRGAFGACSSRLPISHAPPLMNSGHSRVRRPVRAPALLAVRLTLCWCVDERQHEVARTLDSNHQHDAFGGLLSERKRLAGILARDPIDYTKVPIGPLLDNPAPKLSLLVRVVHCND